MKETYEEVLEAIEKRKSTLRAYAQALFRERSDCVLEVGCGNGHYLSAFAAAHPEKFCVGVDLLNKRVLRSQKKQTRNELQNCVFLKAEVRELLEVMPEEVCLSEVFLLFPDPWPKARHHRRRLVQEPFLSLLAKYARPGARLYVRTDHAEYFDWIYAQVCAHPAWELCPSAAWPFEHETLFQKRMGSYQSLIAQRSALGVDR